MARGKAMFVLLGCCALACGRAKPVGSARLMASTLTTQGDVVTRLVVTVIGQYIPQPLVKELQQTDGVWQGTLFDIPAGSDTFSAVGFDAAGHQLMSGSTETTVVAGSTALVALVLIQPAQPGFGGTPPAILSVTGSDVAPGIDEPVTFKVTASDADPADPLSYLWSASDGTFDGAGNSSTATTTLWTAPATPERVTFNITVTEANGGLTASLSFALDVNAGEGAARLGVYLDFAPTVTDITATPAQLGPGGSVAFTSSIDNPDGDAVTYAWSSSCAGTFSPSSADANPTFQSTGAVASVCTFTLNTQDAHGATGSGSIALAGTALPSPEFAPHFTLGLASTTLVNAGDQVTLQVIASDPQGSDLAFAWSVEADPQNPPNTFGTLGAPTSDATSSQIVWTAPSCLPGPGATVTVTATDAAQLSSSLTFTLFPNAGAVCGDRFQLRGLVLHTGNSPTMYWNSIDPGTGAVTFITSDASYVLAPEGGVFAIHTSDRLNVLGPRAGGSGQFLETIVGQNQGNSSGSPLSLDVPLYLAGLDSGDYSYVLREQGAPGSEQWFVDDPYHLPASGNPNSNLGQLVGMVTLGAAIIDQIHNQILALGQSVGAANAVFTFNLGSYASTSIALGGALDYSAYTIAGPTAEGLLAAVHSGTFGGEPGIVVATIDPASGAVVDKGLLPGLVGFTGSVTLDTAAGRVYALGTDANSAPLLSSFDIYSQQQGSVAFGDDPAGYFLIHY